MEGHTCNDNQTLTFLSNSLHFLFALSELNTEDFLLSRRLFTPSPGATGCLSTTSPPATLALPIAAPLTPALLTAAPALLTLTMGMVEELPLLAVVVEVRSVSELWDCRGPRKRCRRRKTASCETKSGERSV